jgi:hypothetical protein
MSTYLQRLSSAQELVVSVLSQRTKYAAEITRRLRRVQFELMVRPVIRTPSATCTRSGPTVLSMVQHKDVLAWLIAAKSFLARIDVGRVVVVADPTLTERDRELISDHVIGVSIVDARAFQHADLPTGGCWERLQAIAHNVASGPVIQLDADTLSLGALSEVAEAVRGNYGFALVSEDDTRVQTADEISAYTRRMCADDPHIQTRSEAVLSELGLPWLKRYIRGCAGFTGFQRGAFDMPRLIEFSQAMERRLGPVWRSWGSEQVASNVMLANAPSATHLPHPTYCAPDRYIPGAQFVHFIGYLRFETDLYMRLALGEIRRLRSKS